MQQAWPNRTQLFHVSVVVVVAVAAAAAALEVQRNCNNFLSLTATSHDDSRAMMRAVGLSCGGSLFPSNTTTVISRKAALGSREKVQLTGRLIKALVIDKQAYTRRRYSS
jgi:hypothetical protein